MDTHHRTSPSNRPVNVIDTSNVFLTLLPITLAVLVGFLTFGLPLPVLPVHIQHQLGFGPIIVGILISSQFAAALLTRAWAGNMADGQGARQAMTTGFWLATASGFAYLASHLAFRNANMSLILLLIGRVILGAAESLIVTGALAWGIGLVGPQRAGKVMAWVGMAMYAAYAAGAPIGTQLYARFHFSGIALAAICIPLLALLIIQRTPAVKPSGQRRVPFYKVLGDVWLPGLGLAATSIGFGVITAFIALLFAAKQWEQASLAFTTFGIAFIVARLLFGHLPDQLGGAKVALVCVVIEAGGQWLIWQASTPAVAYLGAALTGFGYSLAFPGFGVEAVKRAPADSRGVAMGAYVAFLDIALGLTGPVMGWIAGQFSVKNVYLVSTLCVASAVLIASQLLRQPGRQAQAVAR
ncbi:arabinose transporter [Chitinivorax sp. B]|uniref:arabinose transporter n=1 Tax=Chitinivorax sp. B TaxID=2502235 RepID=UPI0010F4CCFC|nr:arabinose transporter [Chitinivorax sp. B]